MGFIKLFRDDPSFLDERSKRYLPVLVQERNLTERTLWILQAYNTYVAMSNNSLSEVVDQKNYGSLEDIHNAVHNLVGGIGGHMAAIEVSAFDPIFWLRKYSLMIPKIC